MIEKIKYCPVSFPKNKSFTFDHVHIIWNRHIPFHQHAAWQITYMIKGSGTRIIGEVVEPFSSGEIVLVPPDLPHCWAYDKFELDTFGKIENITIVFPGTLLEKLATTFPELELYLAEIRQYEKAVKFEGDTLHALQSIITEMKTQNDIEQMSSLLRLFYVIGSSNKTQIVGFSSNKREKAKEKLLDISRYMVNNSEHKIMLDDVAKYLGMNRSAFCTFFKREKGKSFISFLNEYRVDCSCVMLRDTNMPIADICFAVGFEDIPHYNRTFKKLKKETPKSYRIKHQKVLSAS